jgi:hypothetical protein
MRQVGGWVAARRRGARAEVVVERDGWTDLGMAYGRAVDWFQR